MEKKIMGDEDVERDKMIGSPSSDGKMVIKLKINPKLAAAMEGEKSPSSEDVSSKTAKEGETMNQGKRVCPECQKEFSSGKALGGHMRVHVQAANKNSNTILLKPLKTPKFKKTAHRDFNNNGDENLKLSDMMKKEQKKPYYTSCVNDDGKPTCSLCGKTFPSMKSLFGHMRCHPERVWRGILPPPNTPTAAVRRRKLVVNKPNSFTSSPSTSSSENRVDDHGDEVVDLTKFLRGWSVTERRGRRALKAAADDDDDDEVLLEAVEDLMSLAQGDQSMPEQSDVTQRLVIEGSNSNSLTNKDHKIDENSPSMRKGKAAMEEEIKPSAKMEVDDDAGHVMKNFSDNESDSRNNSQQLLINYKYKNPIFSSPYKSSPTKVKKRKKMKLMMELEQFTGVAGDSTPPPPLLLPMTLPEQPGIAESKYKCSTCNKCFASHQALGGHRSSHNKTKITSTESTEACDYESSLMNNQSGENTEKEVEFAADAMGSNGIHQCKICDKIFPTGQALGGHKRCHWTGTTDQAQAPSSQITSAGEAASQTDCGRRKGLNIDLNEFPPIMMEDEAGNGNGNGYASSSYNSYMG